MLNYTEFSTNKKLRCKNFCDWSIKKLHQITSRHPIVCLRYIQHIQYPYWPLASFYLAWTIPVRAFEFFQEVLSLKHKYGKLKILIQIKLKMLHIYDVGGASSTLLFMLLLLAYLDNTWKLSAKVGFYLKCANWSGG